MSVLPPEIHHNLNILLQTLSSPDNASRSHAEEQLNLEWVAARPDVLLMGLVEQIQQSADLSVGRESSAWHGMVRMMRLMNFLDTIVRCSDLSAYSN